MSLKCTHLRIRDDNDYDINVENVIKSLEAEYKVDFRCLPNWKYLTQRLHVAATDYKRKIQGSRTRKNMIIEKLYIQSTRPSPFDLTSGLCRTASKWRKMEIDRKKRKKSEAPKPATETTDTEVTTVLEEISEALHFNTNVTTESPMSPIPLHSKLKIDTAIDTKMISDIEISPDSHLPVAIFTNPRKLISPLGSQSCGMSFRSLLYDTESKENLLKSVKEEWQCLTPTSSVVCIPTPIILTNNNMEQQFVQFTVINRANEYMHIRFKSLIDDSYFLKTKILPAIPKRLFPGIPIVFKFIFKLRSQEEFNSGLYFKVGRDVCDDVPPEAFCIPIKSEFIRMQSVEISESITMPPVYPWHIKRNGKYSTATVKISVNDPRAYHLHVYKQIVDLAAESDMNLSTKATGSVTVNGEERELDINEDIDPILSLENIESESMKMIESINFIIQNIIELALETFVFKSTYLYLKPYEKVKIPVYFTKMEHIGCHNSLYNFDLLEPGTEKLIMTKTLKVFAEVLPNPIKIRPCILDMSESPISHGYFEDHFEIINLHKQNVYSIKIKLTTKMKKMITVDPMQTAVLASSSANFTVRFCSREVFSVRPYEDLVHFTFKIIACGHKSIYADIPPFFYEVIAPCAKEFKKIYNEKYFKDEPSLVLDLEQL